MPSLPDDAGSTTTGKSPSLPSSCRTCSASVQRRRQDQLRVPPHLPQAAERRQRTISCTAPKAISFMEAIYDIPSRSLPFPLFAPAAFRKPLATMCSMLPSRRQRSALSAHQNYELLSLRHRFRYRNTPQLPWKTLENPLQNNIFKIQKTLKTLGFASLSLQGNIFSPLRFGPVRIAA